MISDKQMYVEGLRDKLDSQGQLKRRSLINSAGIIELKLIISSNNITRNYYGTASSLNVKNDFKLMVYRAIQQGIVKHILEGGNSSPQVQIEDYKIIYLKPIDVIIKRENWKGKYYYVTRDKKTKRIKSRVKYTTIQKENL